MPRTVNSRTEIGELLTKSIAKASAEPQQTTHSTKKLTARAMFMSKNMAVVMRQNPSWNNKEARSKSAADWKSLDKESKRVPNENHWIQLLILVAVQLGKSQE